LPLNTPSATERPPDGGDTALGLNDPVVWWRRAIALAGHTGDAGTARAGLADPSPVVRATALGALNRLGRLEDADLLLAYTDPGSAVRRRACELTATRPQLASHLVRLLGESDPRVVEAACFALGELGGTLAGDASGHVTALAHVTAKHADPLCREAAVAALGAIGNDAGLPAILAATTDRPAVRRRAVLALAPFEGPEVDAALAAALEDRDWQVRQAAEDLTAP
jgi:HEAT repeat protein